MFQVQIENAFQFHTREMFLSEIFTNWIATTYICRCLRNLIAFHQGCCPGGYSLVRKIDQMVSKGSQRPGLGLDQGILELSHRKD